MKMIHTVVGALGMVPWCLEKNIGVIWSHRNNWDYPDYNTVKIGQNIQKRPENTRSYSYYSKEQLVKSKWYSEKVAIIMKIV